jgi:hypothetical protein
MSIVRTALVLGVIVAVLPTDEAQQARLFQQVSSGAHWAVTFCDRNGALCTAAGEAWTGFVKKAEFGARLAYDVVQKQLAAEREAPVAPAADVPARPGERGTLNRGDLQPGWRGGDRSGA